MFYLCSSSSSSLGVVEFQLIREQEINDKCKKKMKEDVKMEKKKKKKQKEDEEVATFLPEEGKSRERGFLALVHQKDQKKTKDAIFDAPSQTFNVLLLSVIDQDTLLLCNCF